MAKSRLAEILEYERRGGAGSLDAILSAVGGRLKERSDIRGKLFGREGTAPSGLAQSLGRAVFGAGYSATGRTARKYTGTKISRVSPSVSMADSFSSQVMINMDDKLAKIDKKIEIVAKNTMAQNKVARDINVMRQNIQLMAKSSTGKVRNNADMYFMNAKQRENEYERQFGKTSTAQTASASSDSTENKKEFGFNLFGLAKGFLKGAAFGGAIYTIFKTVEGLYNIFKQIESFISEKIQPFMSTFLEWKKTWDNFNLQEWIKSITPDQLGSVVNSITNFFKDSGLALSSEAAKLISKIPADSLSELISTLIDNFLTVAKAIGSKLGEAFSSMNTEDLLKAATAGGLLALLFGGPGSSIVGGFMGRLLSDVLTGLGSIIVKNPVVAAGALAGMGLGILADKAVEKGNEEAGRQLAAKENERTSQEEKFVQGMLSIYPNKTEEELRMAAKSLPPKELNDAVAQLTGISNVKGNSSEEIKSRRLLEEKIKQKFDASLSSDRGPGRNLVTPEQVAAAKKKRGQKVEPMSSQEMKTGEETSKTRLEKKLGQGFLTGADWDFYTNKLGQQESGNNYKADNGLGFVGRYQFGSEALETFEYLKPGMSKIYGARGANAAVYHPDAWMPGWSLERFLNDTAAQDQTFMKFTKNNFNALKNKDIITPDTTIADTQAWLYAAHHGGVGGAIELSKGNDIKDFAYADSSVGKSFKMMQSGTMTAGEGTFSGIGEKLAGAGAKISSAALGTLDKAEDIVLNLYNNFVNAAQSQQSQADTKLIQDTLGSADLNSIKDFMNPIMMKYTLTTL